MTAAAPVGAPAGAADGPQARYFIGLRPAPAVRARLHRVALALAAKHGGRAVPAARMHMTLVFLGQTPRALEPALLELLRTLPPAEALRLEHLGAFGPRLLWTGPATTPEWLEALSARARAGLDALGASFDRKAFRPHVTLLRSARQGLLPGESVPAIDFGPSELLLVDSLTERPGGHYRWISP